MKKAVVFFSMLMLCMALVACGKDDTENQSTAPTESQGSLGEAMDEDETAQGGSQATEGGQTEGADTTQPQDGSVDEPAQAWSEEMEGLKTLVTDALGENYWPNMMLDAAMLEQGFGITSDMYDDYLAEMPMISTNVDTLVIVKAKEGQAEAVEEALNTYRDSLVNSTMQYPMNVGKIQASRVQTIGDYVCFVQLGGDTTEISESGDDAVITHCLEQNELVIEVLSAAVVK